MRLSVRALKPEVREIRHLQERITAVALWAGGRWASSARGRMSIISAVTRCSSTMPHKDDQVSHGEVALFDWLGEDGMIARQCNPLAGSEDFAFLLEHCPGSYLIIGNGDGEEAVAWFTTRADIL